MRAKLFGLVMVAVMAFSPTRAAVVPAAAPPTVLPSQAADSLAAGLRGLMLQFIPSPLHQDTKHWGMQKEVERIKWMGQGLKVHPEKVKELKNHGAWSKVVVLTPMLPQTLVCQVRNLVQPEPGRMTFILFLAFDTSIDYERQKWENGVRLWSGSVRAKMKVNLTLDCEVQSRLETTAGLLPDMVFRLRVARSDLHYDDLSITHIPGIGGELAQMLGEAIHSTVKKLKPSLERKLLDKGNAAIVKAADSKEVRISLMKILGGK
jgi:hypothetical protein